MSFSCCLFGKPVTSPNHLSRVAEKKEDELKRVASGTSELNVAVSSATSSSIVPPRCTPKAGEISAPSEEDPVIAKAMTSIAPLSPIHIAGHPSTLTSALKAAPSSTIAQPQAPTKKRFFNFGL